VSQGRGLEFGRMVNICECLINAVIQNKLNTHAIGLSQNGKAVGTGSREFPVMGNRHCRRRERQLKSLLVHILFMFYPR